MDENTMPGGDEQQPVTPDAGAPAEGGDAPAGDMPAAPEGGDAGAPATPPVEGGEEEQPAA